MDNTYALLAEQTFELYQAFISAGFSEEQALEMTKSQYSFALVNYQAETQRKRTRMETLRKNIARYKSDGEATCP